MLSDLRYRLRAMFRPGAMERELATALGAGSCRLIRQLLMENVAVAAYLPAARAARVDPMIALRNE